MARKRDYAAEYARRQQRARAAGFEGYYQQRTGGAKGAELARRRGHRGTADFLRSLREGDLILCDITTVEIDAEGRYVKIEKTVIPADLGESRDYVLRRLTRARLVEVIRAEVARGVIFSPAPSMDQRRLIGSPGAQRRARAVLVEGAHGLSDPNQPYRRTA